MHCTILISRRVSRVGGGEYLVVDSLLRRVEKLYIDGIYISRPKPDYFSIFSNDVRFRPKTRQ